MPENSRKQPDLAIREPRLLETADPFRAQIFVLRQLKNPLQEGLIRLLTPSHHPKRLAQDRPDFIGGKG